MQAQRRPTAADLGRRIGYRRGCDRGPLPIMNVPPTNTWQWTCGMLEAPLQSGEPILPAQRAMPG